MREAAVVRLAKVNPPEILLKISARTGKGSEGVRKGSSLPLAFILSLICVIASGFVVNLFLAKPDWGAAAAGLVPSLPTGSLYIILGIIGATVMPHNLYLHSALVQTRKVSRTIDSKAQACKYNFFDSVIALNAAFFINSAILILAAAVFFRHGIVVTEIQQADKLLEELLGSNIAPLAFGLALLAAGQSSTLTWTLARQIVMEGFVRIRLRPYLRHLITRLIALLPAVVVIWIYGDQRTYKLLVLSQVILSLQLPFAIVPLVHFTSDKLKMGSFASRLWVKVLAWITSIIIIALNGKLVFDKIMEWIEGGAPLLLTLVHVVDSAPAQVYSNDVYDEHTRDDEQYLLEIATEVRALEVAVEIALPHGDPSEELIDFAVADKVDMLVMGSHGHRLLSDLLWGETVDPVRHQVEIPVMVVR